MSQIEGTGSALGFGGAVTSIALGILQQEVVYVQGCILLSLCQRFRFLRNNAIGRLSGRKRAPCLTVLPGYLQWEEKFLKENLGC